MGLVPLHRGDVRLGRRLAARQATGGDRARRCRRSCPRAGASTRTLTVEENLRLGLAARRDRASRAAFERVYDLFPAVWEYRRRRAGALSGGQQQQLAIGRALVAGPDLLLLDEPSLGLAPKIVDVVFDALAGIRRQGLTVLLVEQRAQRTVAFADRTYLIANGKVRLTLAPEDAGDTDRMVAAYLS